MQDYYVAKSKVLEDATRKLVNESLDEDQNKFVKRRKHSYSHHDVIKMPVIFIRSLFDQEDLPKSVLVAWTKKKRIQLPEYQIFPVEKHFYAIVSVDGKRYSSIYL